MILKTTEASLTKKLDVEKDEVNYEEELHSEEPDSFLSPSARLAFARLRLATTPPILRHFDVKSYICIETDASGYAIGGILSQLDEGTGNGHPIAYYSSKMISVERSYETQDAELLAIIDVGFPTC